MDGKAEVIRRNGMAADFFGENSSVNDYWALGRGGFPFQKYSLIIDTPNMISEGN
jgi:hypothetical protein